MNRHAVALAADSVTTVSYWRGGEREERYFQGANKIFNLSKAHPVGIMTYGTANLQGVPWEVVVKAFRRHLGNRPHAHLDGYAQALFKFVEGNRHILPVDCLEKYFRTTALNQAYIMIASILVDKKYKGAKSAKDRTHAATQVCNRTKLQVTKAALLGNASSEDIERALAQFKKVVIDALEALEIFKKHIKVLDIDEVSETAITSLFKRGISLLDDTGIVVVGYGDEDYFPSAIVYRCHGVVLEKLLFTEESRKHINQDDVSHIMPLAQSDMVNTFVHGISPSAAQEIEQSFSDAIDEFCNTIKINGGSAQKARNKACEDFLEDILTKMFDSHTMPLKRVVGNLPIDELADLAETLPIRLTPMTATCRVPPLSRVKLGIGWSRGVARDAEQ